VGGVVGSKSAFKAFGRQLYRRPKAKIKILKIKTGKKCKKYGFAYFII
jgi:hypothetical protein